MKTAPEKIYLQEPTKVRTEKKYDNDVEYTRTDAFLKKACEYMEEHLFDYWSQSVTNESKFIEDFKKYMEGE